MNYTIITYYIINIRLCISYILQYIMFLITNV